MTPNKLLSDVDLKIDEHKDTVRSLELLQDIARSWNYLTPEEAGETTTHLQDTEDYSWPEWTYEQAMKLAELLGYGIDTEHYNSYALYATMCIFATIHIAELRKILPDDQARRVVCSLAVTHLQTNSARKPRHRQSA